MDANEVIKRAKRALDGYISYRKLVLAVLLLLVVLLYCGPSIFRLVLHTRPTLGEDTASRSLALRLDRFWQAAQELDVHILHSPPLQDERPFLPYIGNGLLGVTPDQESPIYIRSGRTLHLPINYRPITLVSLDGMMVKEAVVTEYTSGVVHRIQSWELVGGAGGALDVLYQTYAHRTMPSLLLQDIKVINPTDRDVIVEVEQMGLGDWPGATTNTIKLHHGEGEHEYTVISGSMEVPDAPSKVIPVAIITLKVPPSLQAPAPLHEVWTSEEQRASILRDIAYAEGCYGEHHTLQAERLWSHLSTIEDVNRVVGYWMVTLEKQGCHQLVRAGANGIMQAMILSFGGLRFRNQHLEFDTHPKDLHRDYFFRRVSYGNSTHLNISVAVQEEDYKALIYTALDRSDRNYYACDAGCLDRPVELKQEKQTFPVKLTDPVTAILYITSDLRHMEELKHTIHVKEIALAPAHEHHVIAMHKHGHKWGGLPTLFWLTIIALILIFHLFLIKLVINEYCGSDVKTRYRKLSDF